MGRDQFTTATPVTETLTLTRPDPNLDGWVGNSVEWNYDSATATAYAPPARSHSEYVLDTDPLATGSQGGWTGFKYEVPEGNAAVFPELLIEPDSGTVTSIDIWKPGLGTHYTETVSITSSTWHTCDCVLEPGETYHITVGPSTVQGYERGGFGGGILTDNWQIGTYPADPADNTDTFVYYSGPPSSGGFLLGEQDNITTALSGIRDNINVSGNFDLRANFSRANPQNNYSYIGEPLTLKVRPAPDSDEGLETGLTVKLRYTPTLGGSIVRTDRLLGARTDFNLDYVYNIQCEITADRNTYPMSYMALKSVALRVKV